MEFIVLIDFGSTFTKSTVVSLEDKQVVYTFRTPSTVQTDANIGLQICLDAIGKEIGSDHLQRAYKLASSSAAGGLRMVVVGLTDSLSATAGKNAAYGAGAKVIKTFARRLTDENVEEICRIRPEILLLCGGYEGGNSSWVLENAWKLAAARIDAPIVYAGNSEIQNNIRLLFNQYQKSCVIARNIIPAVQQLDIASTVEAVRDIFMKRITHMKGFDTVKNYVGNIVMPTPAAVLEGVKLLAEGTASQAGWGQVLLVDMGGATTDIHSYAAVDTMEGVHFIGAAEPTAKRTVEGDIGMRESIASLVAAADIGRLCRRANMTEGQIGRCVKERLDDHAFLPLTAEEKLFEQAAAMEGVYTSVRRHAGRIYDGYARAAQKVQQGKDLRAVSAVIGTGGPIIDSLNPGFVLQEALRKEGEEELLLPSDSKLYLDSSYIIYAAGLLSRIDRETAFSMMSRSLIQLYL